MIDEFVKLPEPKDHAEYVVRFQKNQKVEGYGVGNVHIHVPCPFCAAPDFMKYEILEVEAALQKGAECKHCDRGIKSVIVKEGSSTTMTMVQTSGPDQPEWYTPKMPRQGAME